MAKNINFEVQIMQGGRWTIHARFPSTQREQAIEEAKQLDASKIGGSVRVIRDVYDSESGTSNEFTIYKSGGMAASGGGGGGPSSSFADIDDDDDDYIPDDDSFVDDPEERQRIRQKRKERDKKEGGGSQTSLTGLVVKLLLILLGSTVLSVASVFGANILLEGANIFGVRMRGAALENFLILLFFIVFITTAIIFSTQAFKGKKLKERAPRKQRARRAPAKAPRPKPAAPPAQERSMSVESTGMDDLRADVAQLKADLPDSEDDEDESPEPAPEAPPEDAAQEADEEKPEEKAPDEESDQAPAPPDAADADSPMSPHDQKQKSYMMDFMNEALKGAGQSGEAMSNFDKFGVSLYAAGASEALSQKRELSEEARAKIIADGVQTMGFKKSHAKSFAEKYEEYLVQDPTYMQMFQAGRNAMNTYFTDNTHAGKHMASALQEWNKPKKKEDEVGPVTVLFTDLAGSTAMTQALGDAGAQQVVRAHNRIVREALSQWAGKEVKHTGDGIMASFVKTSDSLDAAIQMQRESEKERERNPDLPLHLKIGINSGEPISEDNDLFGSTVQMSARIVDKAQADEIFVSEIVRGICAGKTYKFENRGTYPMKGFDTDPTLYEVVWKE